MQIAANEKMRVLIRGAFRCLCPCLIGIGSYLATHHYQAREVDLSKSSNRNDNKRAAAVSAANHMGAFAKQNSSPELTPGVLSASYDIAFDNSDKIFADTKDKEPTKLALVHRVDSIQQQESINIQDWQDNAEKVPDASQKGPSQSFEIGPGAELTIAKYKPGTNPKFIRQADLLGDLLQDIMEVAPKPNDQLANAKSSIDFDPLSVKDVATTPAYQYHAQIITFGFGR